MFGKHVTIDGVTVFVNGTPELTKEEWDNRARAQIALMAKDVVNRVLNPGPRTWWQRNGDGVTAMLIGLFAFAFVVSNFLAWAAGWLYFWGMLGNA